MVISRDAEKHFLKTLIIKILSKLKIARNFLYMIQSMYKVYTANIIINSETLKNITPEDQEQLKMAAITTPFQHNTT